MTHSARDRSAIQFAGAIRDRTLAALGEAPSTAVIHQIAEEIHLSSPQTSRLKCMRLANGWTVEEAIERFHDMCDRSQIKRRGLSERSWREWEAGARPDREYTDLLCRLFETGPVQLGFARDYTPEEARRAQAGAGDPIADAAAEASEHAEEAETSELGSGALERLRTQVIWVGRRYVWETPLPLFVEMRALQEQTRKALERRIHPTQAGELYFLTGALCGLMANASMDMGRRVPADTLARASWTYGRISGHPSLMGWARGMQASVALWDRRYEDAVRYAGDALTHLSTGSGGARLHMLRARACAMLGRSAEARDELHRASQARASGGPDELHDEIAGEFAFRPAKEHYYAAVTHLHLGQAPRAIEEARAAIALYSADERENRSYGCEAMARAHLAIAYVLEDDQEGAEQAVAPLLELPPERRIDSLGATLAASRSLVSDRMARQIEGFCSVGLAQTRDLSFETPARVLNT
ncbi:hypothetical protein GCM10009555_075920 [Acrocarpospora macrocephala]|uniref:HTH cro/C1-type domain-containing protein n=1 Tax=Acrocarpospora macrocephala TaxID=150177 RepID=A0A5M3WX10_9ACTN|nr:hypothetical protein [Acrocarpospora macrocephala]GES12762.1 hypothetical protein Amac_063590 [Acrocarpospora macrocephala]